MKKYWGLIAVSALALAACDIVRVPGDGREAPEPGPVIPDGAPGPPPPVIPVNDPWDEGDGGDDPVIPVIDETPAENPVDEPVDAPEQPPEDPPADDDADPVAPDPDPDAELDDPDAETPDPEIPDPDAPPADLADPETPDSETPPTDTPDDPVVDEPDADPVDEPVEEPEQPPVDDPVVTPPAPQSVKFEYFAPGDIIPGTGSGLIDETIYAPNMLFPIKTAPTWPQSMVYRLGGAVGGDQCDPANYDIPWRDNFCEKRSSTRNTPLCPTNKVHQGQDIRVGSAADCNALRRQAKSARGLHEVIAVEDGIIQHIGTYSVQLKGTETGNLYSYLHLNMRRLRVSTLDTVSAGDTLGFVSNDFGSTPTTFHLHFEIKAPLEGEGIVHVPPYMSLVAAYERREGGIGERVEDDNVAIASVPVIVDPSKLIE